MRPEAGAPAGNSEQAHHRAAPRPRKRFGVRARAAATLVAVSVLPLVVSGFAAISVATSLITTQRIDQLTSVAEIQESRISVAAERYLERLALVSSRTQLRASIQRASTDPDPETLATIGRILKDARASVPGIRSIHVFGAQGSPLASQPTDAPLPDTAPHLTDAALRVVPGSDGGIGVSVGGPLRVDGRTIGLVVIENDADPLLASLTNYAGLGSSGETILARRDEDGNALFLVPLRFDEDAAFRLRIHRSQRQIPITRALVGEEIVMRDAIDYRGVPVFAVTRVIDDFGWGLAVKIDVAEALAPVRTARLALLLAIGAISLAAIGASLWLGRSITRPIVDLTATARRISAGDLGARADERRTGELGELAAAFNTLVAELVDAQENLEHRVVARTADLAFEVAERRRTEAALRESEERQRLMIDSIRDYAIFLLDPDGNVASWNRGAQRTMGYLEREILGQKHWLFYPPNDQAAGLPERLIETARAEGRVVHEGWRVAKGGRRYWAIEAITAVWGQDDELRGFASITRDLTERRQAEEALEARAAELRRSNEELAQFASVASHDLQEPLRSVTGFVQLLERRYNDKLDDEGREYIRFAVDAVTRMRTLINDLLALSRVGTVEIDRTSVDLNAVLASVKANLAASIEAEGGEVTSGTLPAVDADASQMSQLLQNLIENGLKFRGEDPPHVHVDAARIDGAWQISVKDNGIGIEEKFGERIFEVFRRLHTRAEYAGTGVGLAICKKIVERHGGRIWVDSGAGAGATFHFTLRDGGTT